MKSAAGFALALAMAGPAAARGLPNDMKPRSIGLPASAIPADGSIGQGGTGALDEGRALLTASNPAQALSAFQVALAQAPQSVAALNGMAIAYDRLGRSDLARQHFEMALALEPDAADIAYNLGLALVRGGEDRAAIAHLQRAAAGRDARVAAAARRSLTQIAARLTGPAPPVATAVAPGPRIDMASSGEAVLVLAPTAPRSPPSPSGAPVRMATVAPAPIDAQLAERLGEVAALTIPINLPAPAPEAVEKPPVVAEEGLLAAPRRMAAAPAAPASPPPAGPARHLPVSPARLPATVAAQRPSPPPQVLAQWRRAEPSEMVRPVEARKLLAPLPAQDDGKAAIRLAIARLESLIELIEVQRG